MEIKDLQVQIQESFDSLKKAGERQSDEIKKFGDATQETKTMITRINEDIDGLKSRLEAVEAGAERKEFGLLENQKQDETKGAFFKFIREGKSGLNEMERKALVQDATGEIIVPEALDSEIKRDLPKLTLFRSLSQVRSINTNRIRSISMNEVTVGWGKLETSTTATLSGFESSLSPSEAYQYVENVYGLTKIGEDELTDSDQNLQAYLASSFTQAFAEAEDRAFLLGTGHANNQPQGVLSSGSGVTSINTADIGAVSADDLIKLSYEVASQYRRGGAYVVKSSTELALRLLKDANGQYLWQPSLQAGAPNTFNGFPIYTQEDMAAIANDALPVLFGNFKAGYRVLDRDGGAITRLNELYIEDGLIGFKYKRRVGGGVQRAAAFKSLKVRSV